MLLRQADLKLCYLFKFLGGIRLKFGQFLGGIRLELGQIALGLRPELFRRKSKFAIVFLLLDNFTHESRFPAFRYYRRLFKLLT